LILCNMADSATQQPTQIQIGESTQEDETNMMSQSYLQTQYQTDNNLELDEEDDQEANNTSIVQNEQEEMTKDTSEKPVQDLPFDEEEEEESEYKDDEEAYKEEESHESSEEEKVRKVIKKKSKARKRKHDSDDDKDFNDESQSEPPTPSEKSPVKKRKTEEKKRKTRSSKKDEPQQDDNNFIVADEEDDNIDTDKLDRHRSSEEGASTKKKSEFDNIMREISHSRRSLKEDVAQEQSHVAAKLLVTKMTVAYNDDLEALRDHKPATKKLILLPEVVKQATKIYMQSALIDADFLIYLSDWIAPMEDGSLPNMNIRSAVLKILTDFPVAGETFKLKQRRDDFAGIEKENLKESKIAQHVKILAEHPKETAENRRLANDLLQRWSRLVFGLTNDYSQLNLERDDLIEERRSKRLNKQHQVVKEPEKPKPKNPGDPGYKLRAQIPKVEGFDYKKKPKSKITKQAAKANPQPISVSSSMASFQSPVQQRMAKKLLDMKRSQKRY
jgi:transcription factor SPN1